MTIEQALQELHRYNLKRAILVENGKTVAIHMQYDSVIRQAGSAVLRNILGPAFGCRWKGTYFEIKKRKQKDAAKKSV